jgi:hypothetical protein
MDKEELIDYLSENLAIKLKLDWEGSLRVALILEGEEISSSDIYLPEKDMNRD